MKIRRKDYSKQLVFPVSKKGMENLISRLTRSRNPSPRSPNTNQQSINNPTRAHPVHKTEEGTEMQCMCCGYQAPEFSFMSENMLSFKGCPVCANIDHTKYIKFNEDGLIGINKNRTNT